MSIGHIRTTIAAATLAIGMSAAASAAPFNLRIAPGGFGPDGIFASEQLWRNVDITVGGFRYDSFGVGLFGLQYNDDADPGANWIALETFCIEVTQFVNFGVSFEGINITASSLDPSVVEDIRRMWNANFASATTVPAPNSKDRAAAFQIALWEIVDGYDGLDEGDFILHTAETGLVNLIDLFLLDAKSSTGGLAELTLLTSADGQDQIFPRVPGGPGGAGDPVPAPASLALLGAALVGLGAIRRRKQA